MFSREYIFSKIVNMGTSLNFYVKGLGFEIKNKCKQGQAGMVLGSKSKPVWLFLTNEQGAKGSFFIRNQWISFINHASTIPTGI